MLLLTLVACSLGTAPPTCPCETVVTSVVEACAPQTVLLPEFSDLGDRQLDAGDPHDNVDEDSLVAFEVPEHCEGGWRIANYDAGRAIHTVRRTVPDEGEVAATGLANGRAEGVRVRLRKGQVLRMRDVGEDCPGVNLLSPDGDLVYEGLLTGAPVDVYIEQTGDWEVGLLGYAGAHGNNAFDLRLSLTNAPPRIGSDTYRRYDGRYPHDLMNVPGARLAFARALGAQNDRFWENAGVQTPMRLVRSRWLVGTGCIPEACTDGGGWFVVDATNGAITAAFYGTDDRFQPSTTERIRGRLEDLPADVQAVVREEIR